MKEDLLQYVWRFQLFNKKKLKTTCGKEVKILRKGLLNVDTGPDFLEVSIQLAGVTLHGTVEIHVKGSDWYQHGHDGDAGYDNVLLHVVWEDDVSVLIGDRKMPTLVLADFVNHDLLGRYNMLMDERVGIPCGGHLELNSEENWNKMIRRSVLHRLKKKCKYIYTLFKYYKENSEDMVYALLGRSFGFKVNGDAFLELCRRVPLSLAQQYAKHLPALEALFLGQAGFLHDIKSSNGYVKELLRMHKYLQRKYKLKPALERIQWRFSRLHPANFPTIRIAQFAQLLSHVLQKGSIFCYFMNASYEELCTFLCITPSQYWRTHYRINIRSSHKIPSMGIESAYGIIINMVVPLCVAYGRLRDEALYMERAVGFLKRLPAEKNRITRKWRKLKVQIKNAFDSQGVIGLLNDFCTKKQCLSCVIGQDILQRGSLPSIRGACGMALA